VSVFHKIPRLEDGRLAGIFVKEVLRFLVGRELLGPEWAERILYYGLDANRLAQCRKTSPLTPTRHLPNVRTVGLVH
jgi:hypothetical protein